MLAVHIVDNPIYIPENEIAVRLPEYKFLTFDFDNDYFENKIEGNIAEEDFWDFVCCSNKCDNILKSSIRNGLTTLSYIFYMTTNSINETVKRLNSLDLEEVVWAMIFDDVIDKFRALYEEE